MNWYTIPTNYFIIGHHFI